MPTKRKGSSERAATKRQKLRSESGPETSEKQAKISDLLRTQKELAELSTADKEARSPCGKSVHSSTKSLVGAMENMYSFTSKRDSTGVIDLTSSSPPPVNGVRRIGQDITARANAFAPHQGAVKLLVKNQRSTPRIDPEEYFQREWKKLEAALQMILRGEKATLSLGELYRSAENICRQGRSEDLHGRLYQLCRDHVGGSVLDTLVAKVFACSKTDFLIGFMDVWATWCGRMATVRDIFSYMDQTYLRADPHRQRLADMGNQVYQDLIFGNSVVKKVTIDSITDLIDSERKTQPKEQSTTLLKAVLPMLHTLNVYDDFQTAFVATTQTYFEGWTAQAKQGDLATYATGCQALTASEMKRCDYGFQLFTRNVLTTMTEHLLIKYHKDFLTNQDSVLTMLEDNNVAALKDLYGLLCRVDWGADLVPIFEEFIRTEGSAIVFDEARESEMVVRLLDFKKRLDRIHSVAFRDDAKLGDGLHKAFGFMMNKTKKSQANWDTDNAKPGEMIAKYVDLLLKGGVRAIPRLAGQNETGEDIDPQDHDAEETQIDHHLTQALNLFRFVHGKAVFEAFYKKDLARRLLMGRSNSDDAERHMLNQLRTECGSGFTRNLETMFKDMELARDEMRSYTQLQRDRHGKSHGPDLNVSVLSSASWPSYPDVPIIVPPTISHLLSAFETHYLSKHSGRVLQWKHTLAHCQLRANYPNNTRKELVVSGFQAVILLLFNDTPTPTTAISYSTLLSTSQLPPADLNRTLQSLACGKHRLLLKHPRGREVSPTDTFSWNAGFRDPKTHIKINQIQLVETREENRATHVRVQADRHYETQAAVVRIMKARKELGHAELVAEVISATRKRGVLELGEIKKNIDKLIEKEYMERVEGNRYAYVA